MSTKLDDGFDGKAIKAIEEDFFHKCHTSNVWLERCYNIATLNFIFKHLMFKQQTFKTCPLITISFEIRAFTGYTYKVKE